MCWISIMMRSGRMMGSLYWSWRMIMVVHGSWSIMVGMCYRRGCGCHIAWLRKHMVIMMIMVLFMMMRILFMVTKVVTSWRRTNETCWFPKIIRLLRLIGQNISWERCAITHTIAVSEMTMIPFLLEL